MFTTSHISVHIEAEKEQLNLLQWQIYAMDPWVISIAKASQSNWANEKNSA